MKSKIFYIVLIIVIIFAGLLAFGLYKYEFKPKSKAVNTAAVVDPEVQKIAEAIKQTESEAPPRIGKSPSEEEIHNSPYIQYIRTALNAYLNGNNAGIEDIALNASGGANCGLNTFDKGYYKSKFIVYDASDNDYGGVQADIVFVDKPETIFWTWVYLLAGKDGDYSLRGFCSNGPPENQKAEFKTYIEEMIKNSQYLY